MTVVLSPAARRSIDPAWSHFSASELWADTVLTDNDQSRSSTWQFYCVDDSGRKSRSTAWRSRQSEHGSSWQLLLNYMPLLLLFIALWSVHLQQYQRYNNIVVHYYKKCFYVFVIFVERGRTVLDLVWSVDLCARMAWILQNNNYNIPALIVL